MKNIKMRGLPALVKSKDGGHKASKQTILFANDITLRGIE